MPKITLLFASLHVLLMLALAMPVVLHRNTHKIGIGDRIHRHAGNDPYPQP